MQSASWLHWATRVALCGMIPLGVLILQGCGEDASTPNTGQNGSDSQVTQDANAGLSAVALAAQRQIYASLDEQFPEGKPAVASVEERGQDEAYLADMRARTEHLAQAESALAKARAQEEGVRSVIRQNLVEKMGVEPNDVIWKDHLAKHAYYQEVLAAVTAAEANVEAIRVENRQAIRERRMAKVDAYNTLKAAADAQAREAGVPVREDGASVVETVKQAEPAPEKVTVTLEQLLKDTGIPVAPANP